jgi:hypothetical protein
MPRPAIPGTNPHYGYLEAEWLMEIILNSGHPQADYLVNKLVQGSMARDVYEELRDRVQTSVTLNKGN